MMTSTTEMDARNGRDARAAYGSRKYDLGVFALKGIEPATPPIRITVET